MVQKQKHLLWRAGFGPDFRSGADTSTLTVNELVKKLFEDSNTVPVKLKGVDVEFGSLMNTSGPVNELSKEAKMQIRNVSREGFKKLNILWLNEMTDSKAQLREKMALFWHGHFACRINNTFFAQDLLHIVRQNALGKFGDLLRAVSKSPAMLSFLNNQQNRKRHPNENFSRELLELFTLGRGQYNETDIKEAARAFTGWGFDRTGQFVFRKAMHDEGEKTFLGKRGNFDGNDILEILLGNKNTAFWITNKLLQYLLGTTIDKHQVEKLSEDFYQSGLDISFLLKKIFTSKWFYQPEYLGAKIKSPVEWIVGIRRTLPVGSEKNEWQLIMQKLLGQVLFFPPNVAGWPGGTNWIDSSTLMYRLRWPMALLNKDHLSVSPKQDDDIEMGGRNEALQQLNRIIAEVNWSRYLSYFKSVQNNLWSDHTLQNLLYTDNVRLGFLTNSSKGFYSDQDLIAFTVHIMSTPEYQVC